MSPIYKSEIVTLVNLNCVYAYEGYICIGYRKEKQSILYHTRGVLEF